MTDKIPKGWKKVKLGDYIKVQNGYAFKSKDFNNTTGIPVIKIKNIASGKLDISDVVYYSKTTEKLYNFFVRKNDILIAMTGSHVNQPSSMVGKVVKYSLQKTALLNQRVGKIYSDDNRILDNTFLFYFLNQKHITFQLASNASGSANQANLSPSLIKNLDILLPPIKEQRAIASVLSSLDDKIDLLQRENKTLEDMAQTLFRKWFIEDAKEDWKKVSLGNSELSKIIKSGIEKFDGEKVYLATGDIENTEIYGGQPITYDKRPSRANMQPVKFSVWFAKKGGVRKLLMFDDYSDIDKYILSTGFTGLKTTELSHYYIWCFLLTKEFQEIKDSFVSGTVQPDINNEGVMKIFISKPDKDVLIKFNKVTKPIFTKIQLNKFHIRKLEQLRDTLLPKLMSGEVRVKV